MAQGPKGANVQDPPFVDITAQKQPPGALSEKAAANLQGRITEETRPATQDVGTQMDPPGVALDTHADTTTPTRAGGEEQPTQPTPLLDPWDSRQIGKQEQSCFTRLSAPFKDKQNVRER